MSDNVSGVTARHNRGEISKELTPRSAIKKQIIAHVNNPGHTNTQHAANLRADGARRHACEFYVSSGLSGLWEIIRL